MIRLYDNVNANKLVDELQAAGLLERESMAFFPKENGLEIKFNSIKEIVTEIVVDEIPTGEILTTYTKPVEHMAILTNEETGEETEDFYFVDEPYDPSEILAAIQVVVDAHDPAPYPEVTPDLTIEERIAQLEILYLQDSGVIE